MADGKFNIEKERPRKANEYFANLEKFELPDMLFDHFWSEGELALLFGPVAAGKSILAFQIAESIASGQGIDGFELEGTRRKVLYADTKLSDRRFITRYKPWKGKPYKLSENLYRHAPPKGEKLIDWLRRMASEEGFRVMVIDDISAVKTTCDGTRETLKLMRELKELRDEFDLSILVLAGSQDQPDNKIISEAQMGRSRVLCDVADTVFAIGVGKHKPYGPRHLVHLRTQSLKSMVWNDVCPAYGHIKTPEDGFVHMSFEEAFLTNTDFDMLEMICNIKRDRDLGVSFLKISEKYQIPKTTVTRLLKKWSRRVEDHVAEMNENIKARKEREEKEKQEQEQTKKKRRDVNESVEREIEDEDDHYDDDENEENEDEENDVEEPVTRTVRKKAYKKKGTDRQPKAAGNMVIDQRFYPADVSNIPFMAPLKRIPITDLKRGHNRRGQEIFILNEQNDGKPLVWYSYDHKTGKFIRTDRDYDGMTSNYVDRTWICSDDLYGLYYPIAGWPQRNE